MKIHLESRADSERDVKIAQARANKASNDEEVKSLQEIAEKQHELNIKTAELKNIIILNELCLIKHLLWIDLNYTLSYPQKHWF